MTAHRLLSPRWLATGGAVVLAGVLGVALLLQNGGSACAAPPGTSAKTGKATFYDLANMGNCSYPSAPADDLFVALGKSEYDGAAACGSYLDVTGPKGKVRVKVVDSCPECEPGHIDLSRSAFKKIGNEVDGIIKVSYKRVRGAKPPAGVSVRVKEGSSRFWLAVLIDNHVDPLASVTIGGKAAQRADFNYWIVDGGAGAGPFTITIKTVYGVTTTLSGIDLSPGKTQKTGVRAGGSGSAPEPATTKKLPKGMPSLSPSPSASSVSASPSVTTSVAAPASDEATGPLEPPAAEPEVDLAAGPSSSCG